MQAGRELDLKVAKALGWKVSEGDGIFCDEDGHIIDEPMFSTTWSGMGILVEEARKQKLCVEYEHTTNDQYMGRVWKVCRDNDWVYMGKNRTKPPVAESAPHAACLAFLEAKGFAI